MTGSQAWGCRTPKDALLRKDPTIYQTAEQAQKEGRGLIECTPEEERLLDEVILDSAISRVCATLDALIHEIRDNLPPLRPTQESVGARLAPDLPVLAQARRDAAGDPERQRALDEALDAV